MGIYERFVFPRLLDCACGVKPIARQREKVVPLAKGRVLEVGLGSGLNLAHYRADQVDALIGLEPSSSLGLVATRRAREQDLPLVLLEASAEQIPLAERSVDSVVITYALCTIPEPSAAIAEFHRVLRPGGRLLLSEHGLAPDPGVRRWQHAMDRLWPHVSGGCHVNRDMAALLGQGGFDTGPLQRGYIPGPRPLSYNYWGALTRRG